MKINTEEKEMTAKEYLAIATREYLSGLAVLAENIKEGEEFGIIEAVVPIKGTHTLSLRVVYAELTEDAKNEIKQEEARAKEDAQRNAEEELGKFGINLVPDEEIQG